MYSVLQNGIEIAIADNLHMIRKQENGYYCLCTKEQAQGFCTEGHVYSLPGKEGALGAEIASYVEISSAERITELNTQLQQLSERLSSTLEPLKEILSMYDNLSTISRSTISKLLPDLSEKITQLKQII